MNKLFVNFQNCFGIGKLEKEFDFSRSNTILVYAPNGTMKTSFANTFDGFSKDPKIQPKDRLYNNRATKCEILIDDVEIKSSSILVINAENNSFNSIDKITTFIASRELKEKYDTIYSILNLSKDDFIKNLRQISQSTDCESEFISTFSIKMDDTFFSLILLIEEQLSNKFDKIDFKYNDVFDKKGNVKKFLKNNSELLDEYFQNYQKLISESSFFKKANNNTFGTKQATDIIKSTDDNSFFEAGHKFVLDGNIEIDSVDDLKNLFEAEVKKIINDEKLKRVFDEVDRKIGTNAELRIFKSIIEKNNFLLVELKDYEGFKKKVWISYFSELKDKVNKLIELYNEKKGELEKIVEEAKKEVNAWRSIIEIFNSRFYVPFKVNITNQEDIILKQETANLEFEYNDKVDVQPLIIKDKTGLLQVLSKGEQRAYYILQFLFDIEARKSQNIESLLVFDDVADSFDYKNKYAIIEYLKDVHNSNLFKSIILTHNFDFYRTVSSRLNLGEAVLMSSKNENREIIFCKGQYRKDIFSHFMQNASNTKIFISLIPFVRNIVEYIKGQDSDDYEKLTSCLHIKDKSENIKVKDVLELYNNILNRNISVVFGEKKVLDLILESAEQILSENTINEILLENKIILSIAIRLKAELYMKKHLPEFDFNTVKSNQTRELFEELKNSDIKKNILLTLDKVNLMTPENIHLNAFMYEPLIDMSVSHLISLYNDLNSL